MSFVAAAARRARRLMATKFATHAWEDYLSLINAF
jgi:hypothetical protein